jgi:hypothetical protein
VIVTVQAKVAAVQGSVITIHQDRNRLFDINQFKREPEVITHQLSNPESGKLFDQVIAGDRSFSGRNWPAGKQGKHEHDAGGRQAGFHVQATLRGQEKGFKPPRWLLEAKKTRTLRVIRRSRPTERD